MRELQQKQTLANHYALSFQIQALAYIFSQLWLYAIVCAYARPNHVVYRLDKLEKSRHFEDSVIVNKNLLRKSFQLLTCGKAVTSIIPKKYYLDFLFASS